MNCETARDLMLEADLAELAPDSGTELGLHMRGCGACREHAERIVADTRALARALLEMRPQRELAAAQRRAATTAISVRARRRAWRRAGLVMPFALAAGVGALLVLGDRNGGPPPQLAPLPTAQPLDFDVEAPAGTNVAVIQTENPQIVVIWYYGAAQ